ncbi:MAG: hypothetical protein J4N28_02915, partial [Chloroflexi bacterium]|nr:hypothetical protein [Chloroflexota bacterium]
MPARPTKDGCKLGRTVVGGAMKNQPPTVLRGRVLLLLAAFLTVALVGVATNALDRGQDSLAAGELRHI